MCLQSVQIDKTSQISFLDFELTLYLLTDELSAEFQTKPHQVVLLWINGTIFSLLSTFLINPILNTRQDLDVKPVKLAQVEGSNFLLLKDGCRTNTGL